jgi:O-antigen/teichoic acid export membrane protein
MVRFRVHGDWQRLRASFEACWIFVGIIVHLGIVATFPFAGLLYEKWTSGRFAFDACLYAVLSWSIGVACIGTPAIRYLQAMNRLSSQTRCNVLYLLTLAVGVASFTHGFGLVGIGAALVLAEIVRTGAALGEVLREVEARVARQLARSVRAALLPAGVSGLALFAASILPAHRVMICGMASLVLLPCFLLQWASLAPMARAQVLARFPGHARAV